MFHSEGDRIERQGIMLQAMRPERASNGDATCEGCEGEHSSSMCDALPDCSSARVQLIFVAVP